MPLAVDIHLWKFMLIRIEFRGMQSLDARHLRSFLIWFNLYAAVKERQKGIKKLKDKEVSFRKTFFLQFSLTDVGIMSSSLRLFFLSVKKFPQGSCVLRLCRNDLWNFFIARTFCMADCCGLLNVSVIYKTRLIWRLFGSASVV